MADPKDTKTQQPTHSRDPRDAKDDAGRLHPYTFNEPRPQAEIVEQAYDHEEPTPTQAENDAAKKAAMYQPEGSGDPQMVKDAEAKKKKDMEAANRPGSYQTKTAT
jgi:hypothetical protein